MGLFCSLTHWLLVIPRTVHLGILRLHPNNCEFGVTTARLGRYIGQTGRQALRPRPDEMPLRKPLRTPHLNNVCC